VIQHQEHSKPAHVALNVTCSDISALSPMMITPKVDIMLT